jgi:hypothetical protein
VRFRPVVGCAYGATLGVLGFIAAGMGHGLYIPLGVSSAPVGFLGVAAALAGAPILWATVGALVARRERLRLSIVLLGVHYATAIWLGSTEPYGDVSYFSDRIRGLESILVAWTIAYLGGQVLLWVWIAREMGIRGRR